MGFESLVAAGVGLIIIIAVSYSLFSGFTASINSMTDTMKNVMDQKEAQMNTAITVEYDYVNVSDNNITFVMHNTGDTKITNISSLQMIISFYGRTNTSSPLTYWIPYTSDINSTDLGWTVLGITPDFVDPGMWNPGEAMACKVVVPEIPPTGDTCWLVVTAPNGASTSGYFNVVNVGPESLAGNTTGDEDNGTA
jgi:archaeal flagellar protein FlaF